MNKTGKFSLPLCGEQQMLHKLMVRCIMEEVTFNLLSEDQVRISRYKADRKERGQHGRGQHSRPTEQYCRSLRGKKSALARQEHEKRKRKRKKSHMIKKKLRQPRRQN